MDLTLYVYFLRGTGAALAFAEVPPSVAELNSKWWQTRVRQDDGTPADHTTAIRIDEIVAFTEADLSLFEEDDLDA